MFWRRLLHSFGVARFAPGQSTIKFSEAIERGHAMGLVETQHSYTACAIGTAYWAKTGKTLGGRGGRSHNELWEMVAVTFNIPIDIVTWADHEHQKGRSRMSIAAKLRQMGY